MSSRKRPEDGLATALQEENIYHADPSQPFNHRLNNKDLPPPHPPPRTVYPTPPGSSASKNRRPTMSMNSEDSQDTAPTAISIAPLQDTATVEGKQGYNPLNVDDPNSFDLVEAGASQERVYSLENRAELLFSKQHLEGIFADPRLFLKFTTFLSKHRPRSIPLLIYYLDATKALRAIAYSNAITDGLEAVSFAEFTSSPPRGLINTALQDKADRAFAVLAQEDLPAYVTHVLVDIVSSSIHRKITGTMAPQLREASEGLAEVFCMADMSKPDSPIVFSSEEFHRTTQYGLNYSIGRNCRFLQGPKSSPFSVRRLREATRSGREIQETFLNYRRDGTPFMNLLTMAPLLDNKGKVRYYIGAQVDVSGLVKDCTNLEAFEKLVLEEEAAADSAPISKKDKKDEFQSLSEMFNQSELETVRIHGGTMHSEQHDLDDTMSMRASNRPRLLIREPSGEDYDTTKNGDSTVTPGTASPVVPSPLAGKLPGVFAHYLILRPHPSLRITFTSPSLRVPGLLQSPFLSRIGGSSRVREELALALSEGRNVTAKIRWLNERFDDLVSDNSEYVSVSPNTAGKARWIHCTPLLGANRAVGAWMVIMIDGEDYEQQTKADRTGVVSPSWGRRPRETLITQNAEHLASTTNGSNAHKLRGSNPRDAQYIHDSAPGKSAAAAAYDNNSEWDLDLDIVTSSAYGQPVPSSQPIGTARTTTERIRSQSSALPPPSRSIPPPMPGATTGLVRTTSGTSTVPRPLSAHAHHNLHQATLSSRQPTLAETYSLEQPRTSSIPSIHLPPTSSSHQHQDQDQEQDQDQPQQQQTKLHITTKASSEALKTKPSLGHRMLNGFLKGSSDRERGKEREREKLKQQDRERERFRAKEWEVQQSFVTGNGYGNGNGNENGYGSAVGGGVGGNGKGREGSNGKSVLPAQQGIRSVKGSRAGSLSNGYTHYNV